MKKRNRKLTTRQFEPMAFAPVVKGDNRLEVKNSGDLTTIDMIGAVGNTWYDDQGITEKDFRNALKSIPKGRKITLNVNSEGGSVQEGLGIYNAIKERSGDITARITGYALSIASVFPLAAGKVVSPKSAIWMIHCAWSWAQGNADDMRKAADMLDVHDEAISDIYVSATGKSKSEIMAAMMAETWIKGSEAVAFGFADETDDDDDDAQASYRPLDSKYLNRCKNISPEILAAVSRPIPQGADSASDNQHKPAPASASSLSAPQGTANKQTTNKTLIMNRAQIIALLKTWGVTINDGMTDEELSCLVSAGKPQASNQAPTEMAKLQARLDDERRARITSEVNRRAENKITNDKLQWWVDMAVKDESGTLAQIDALPVARIGSDPLNPQSIEVSDNPKMRGWGAKPTPKIENIFKQHEGNKEKIYAEVRDNYDLIMTEAQRKDVASGVRPGVMMANTYSATLTTNFLILGAVTKLSPRFAPIKLFARDNSVDPYKPRASGVMKFTSSVQDGSDVLTNATNFNQSNNEIDPVTIPVNQYTAPGSVTNNDLNSGIRMEDIVIAKMNTLGSKIMQVAATNITAANFPATPLITSTAAFGFGNTQTLWGQLKKANIRNLILDGEYVANLTNVPTFFQVALRGDMPGLWTNVFGWDNMALNTEWSTADANVRGFACDPQAIGCIMGLPLIDNSGIPGGILSVSTGTVPGLNMPLAAYMWFDLPSRTYYISFDSMFGANLLDPTAGIIIRSA